MNKIEIKYGEFILYSRNELKHCFAKHPKEDESCSDSSYGQSWKDQNANNNESFLRAMRTINDKDCITD